MIMNILHLMFSLGDVSAWTAGRIYHLNADSIQVFTLYDSISDISIFLEPYVVHPRILTSIRPSSRSSGHRTESILISRFLMNLQEANMRLTNGASLNTMMSATGVTQKRSSEFGDTFLSFISDPTSKVA